MAVFGVLGLFDEEGVLHVASRMVVGDIKGGEIVVFRFYFRAIGNGEPHLAEDVFDFCEGFKDGVDGADLR